MTNLVVAEFGDVDRVLAAAIRVREMGYADVEAYTPFRIPALEAALGIRRTRVPIAAFAAGLVGAIGSYLVLWWTNAIDYRLDVGGRPYNSLPAHVPIVFESTVLFAGAAVFAAVLLASRLPRLHHPIFDIEGFERTSIDRFWITIGDAFAGPADDVRAEELAELERELGRLGAVSVRMPSLSEEAR